MRRALLILITLQCVLGRLMSQPDTTIVPISVQDNNGNDVGSDDGDVSLLGSAPAEESENTDASAAADPSAASCPEVTAIYSSSAKSIYTSYKTSDYTKVFQLQSTDGYQICESSNEKAKRANSQLSPEEIQSRRDQMIAKGTQRFNSLASTGGGSSTTETAPANQKVFTTISPEGGVDTSAKKQFKLITNVFNFVSNDHEYVENICDGAKWLKVAQFENTFTVVKDGNDWKVNKIRALNNFISKKETEGKVPRMSAIIGLGVEIAIRAAERRAAFFKFSKQESKRAPTEIFGVPNQERLKFPFIIVRGPQSGTDLQLGLNGNGKIGPELESGTPEYTNVAYGSPHGTIAHVLATSFGLTKEQVTVSKGTGEEGEESLVAFTLSKT